VGTPEERLANYFSALFAYFGESERPFPAVRIRRNTQKDEHRVRGGCFDNWAISERMSFDCRYLVRQKTGTVIRGPAANRPFASIQYRLQRCTTNVLRRSQTPFVNVLANACALTDTMLMAL
jgi:hypothetical protein